MVVTLTGENEFAIREALGQLVAAFMKKYGPHGVERVDGEMLDPHMMPSLLQGATLFAAQRLIILKNAAANKTVWEVLGNLAQQVPADTTLVVAEPRPDKRTRTYKVLKAAGTFKEFVQPAEGELVQWLQERARSVGGSIARPEAQYLLERAGRDQWRLQLEIEKLVSYRPEVTRQVIDMLVEPTPEGNAFALLDAALAGQAGGIAAQIAQLRTQEDPYKLCGLLASQVYALAVVSNAGTRNADQIAKETGLHPFVVRKTQPLAKKLGAPRVAAIAADVALCDAQLKSTGADPWDLLHLCLLKIAAK